MKEITQSSSCTVLLYISLVAFKILKIMRNKMREFIPTFESTFPSSSSEDQPPSNLSNDTVFWFLDENYPSSGNDQLFSEDALLAQLDADDHHSLILDSEEEELLDGEGKLVNREESTRAFLEEQEQLLLSTLRRTTSTESKIRQATKEALRDCSNLDPSNCHCHNQTSSSQVVNVTYCKSCLQQKISHHLTALGHNCTIRKSKWKSSSQILAGEHTYLEVTTADAQKPTIIIELNFKSEFEMARAGEDYHNRLVSHLPEVFIGKPDRLKILVKLLCAAAKKCVKRKGLHLGPWRKHKYMMSKWRLLFTTPVTTTTSYYEVEEDHNTDSRTEEDRPPNKTSMLTFALLDHQHHHSNLQHRAVAVV